MYEYLIYKLVNYLIKKKIRVLKDKDIGIIKLRIKEFYALTKYYKKINKTDIDFSVVYMPSLYAYKIYLEEEKLEDLIEVE